ncbi:hypothetical protein [Pontibacter sp. H249]|uniref:hypothetical protein n=1 Tax=Pontibacter sp. H249 TaxID=3133420 RepID=UPI0030BB55E0
MAHPYIINTINAILLILLGIFAYFTAAARPLTILVIPFVGILLLACTYHLKKHNRFVFNTVTAITLLAGLLILTNINPDSFNWNNKHVLLLVMSLSCFIAVASYVLTFVRERRLKNNTIYKDDL